MSWSDREALARPRDSYQATQFRIWATKTLREFIVKGFVLDDERLKQGKQVFGKDYFDSTAEYRPLLVALPPM